MTPHREMTPYNDIPDGFSEIMELTQEEKKLLLDWWKSKKENK